MMRVKLASHARRCCPPKHTNILEMLEPVASADASRPPAATGDGVQAAMSGKNPL